MKKWVLLTCILIHLSYNSIGQCLANAGINDTLCTFPTLDTIFLGGTPTALSGALPFTYKWTAQYNSPPFYYTASDFLDDTTSANPRVLYPADGDITFHLEVNDSNGFTCRDSIHIMFSSFTITLDVKEAYIQQGDSVQLYTSVYEGIPPLSYEWSPTTGITDPTDVHTWAMPSTSIEYDLLITDAAGCKVQDNFYVYVLPTSIITYPNTNPLFVLNPNPVTDVSNLSSTSINSNAKNIIYIYDLHGKLQLKTFIPSEGAQIRRSDFGPGYYVYQIFQDGKFVTAGKLIIN